MTDSMYAGIAQVNRTLANYWPRSLGRSLAFRALNRMSARPGVRLEGVTTWGGRFRCDLQDFVSSRIYYFGVWEPNLTGFIERRLTEGDVFVDVGANIGYFSILASRLVGDSGVVVSLEASPSTYVILADDIAINRASNVRALNVAVSDHAGMVPLFAGPRENRGATSLEGGRGGRFEANVPAARLSDLIEPAERARLRLVKIDIEGAELAVLLDLLVNIDAFPSQMEIVVEVAPDAMRDAGTPLELVLERFHEHGFNWYLLENHHDLDAYFDARPRAPRRGTTVPTHRADIVLSRESADTL